MFIGSGEYQGSLWKIYAAMVLDWEVVVLSVRGLDLVWLLMANRSSESCAINRRCQKGVARWHVVRWSIFSLHLALIRTSQEIGKMSNISPKISWKIREFCLEMAVA